MALPIRRARGRSRNQVAAVSTADFSGGLNLDSDQFNLRGNECPELVNMEVDGQGGLRRRRAVGAWATETGDPLGECPRSVWSYEPSDGTRYMFIVAHGEDPEDLVWRSVNDEPFEPVDTNLLLPWNDDVWEDLATLGAAFGDWLDGDPFVPPEGYDGLEPDYVFGAKLFNPAFLARARTAVANDNCYVVWDNPDVPVSVVDPEDEDETLTAGRAWPHRVTPDGVWLPLAPAGRVPAVSEGFDRGFIEDLDAEPMEDPLVAGWCPDGKVVAAHFGHLFVANTNEWEGENLGYVQHRCRVRWSHPGRPEFWRADDYVDVEIGKDGDEITALVPFEDFLLIYKKRSLHALVGDPSDPESLAVVNLSPETGVLCQEAVTVSPMAVFWFDPVSGLWSWDGRQDPYPGQGLRWRGDRVKTLLDDGVIPYTGRDRVRVGWVNSKVWVGVPWDNEATERARTLVYDPMVSTRGAWTLYTLGFGPFAGFRLTDGRYLWAAGCSSTRFLQALELDQDFDLLSAAEGAEPTPIVGSFRTSWVTPQLGAVNQWKRPDLVVSSQGGLKLRVDAFFDWTADVSSLRKTFYVIRNTADGELSWFPETFDDDTEEWVPGDLEDADDLWADADSPEATDQVWASEGMRTVLRRGATLGKGRCLSLRFTTLNDTQPVWRVDGIVFKFKPKRIKG